MYALKVGTGATLDTTKITGVSFLFQNDFPRLCKFHENNLCSH